MYKKLPSFQNRPRKLLFQIPLMHLRISLLFLYLHQAQSLIIHIHPSAAFSQAHTVDGIQDLYNIHVLPLDAFQDILQPLMQFHDVCADVHLKYEDL